MHDFFNNNIQPPSELISIIKDDARFWELAVTKRRVIRSL
jgi:hypothetical protein